MKSNYSKRIGKVSVTRKKVDLIEFKLPKGSISRDDITLYVDYVLTDKSQVVYRVWAQFDKIYLRGLLHCDEFQIKKDEDYARILEIFKKYSEDYIYTCIKLKFCLQDLFTKHKF